jgi:nitroreductase
MPRFTAYICRMQAEFEILKKIITERRTTKAASMNGKVIPNEQIKEILELANWAPTHGRTEPWRFFVYSGEGLVRFGQKHADLYIDNTPEEKQNPDTPGKLKSAIEMPSHAIIAVMKRGTNPKIPTIEEIASASAAVQNVMLGAEALGISAIWNSGGMTHSEALKSELGLAEEDIVLGLIYMGYTDEPKREGKRNTPIEEKTIWEQ